ncbi:hypothetical protein [Enterobacter cloacae complex sp. ECC445]|uniref:hypothetical protein n=1 Tax=Enterobacter cloacae complex sp. ECC445 TaxID=2913213 RepID=UPI003FA49001
MLYIIIWLRGLAGKRRWQWWRWIWGMETGVDDMWRRCMGGGMRNDLHFRCACSELNSSAT